MAHRRRIRTHLPLLEEDSLELLVEASKEVGDTEPPETKVDVMTVSVTEIMVVAGGIDDDDWVRTVPAIPRRMSGVADNFMGAFERSSRGRRAW